MSKIIEYRFRTLRCKFAYALKFRFPCDSVYAVYGHLFPSCALTTCQLFAPRSLLASSLLQPAPPPKCSFPKPCVLHTCTPDTPPSRRETHGLPRFRHFPLQTRQRPRPRWLMSFGFTRLTSEPLLPAINSTISAPTIVSFFRGYFVHLIRFRLGCFAVYASSLSLPPETQDSLHGRAGFSFHGGTFTRKVSATSPGARC